MAVFELYARMSRMPQIDSGPIHAIHEIRV
jgi:hypothetical protein